MKKLSTQHEYNDINDLTDRLTEEKSLDFKFLLYGDAYTFYRAELDESNVVSSMVYFHSDGEKYITVAYEGDDVAVSIHNGDEDQDVEEIVEPEIDSSVEEGEVVDSVEQVRLMGINNDKPLAARIDTGAALCSLHAENIQVLKGGLVKCTMNGKNYKMRSDKTVTVRNSEAEEERPVVTFDVEMDGVIHKGIEFCLDDRADMQYKILIGRNLLGPSDIAVSSTD